MCAWIVELDDTSVKNFADDAEAVVVVVVVNAAAVIVTVAVVDDAAAVALLFHVCLLCFDFSLKKTC